MYVQNPNTEAPTDAVLCSPTETGRWRVYMPGDDDIPEFVRANAEAAEPQDGTPPDEEPAPEEVAQKSLTQRMLGGLASAWRYVAGG